MMDSFVNFMYKNKEMSSIVGMCGYNRIDVLCEIGYIVGLKFTKGFSI